MHKSTRWGRREHRIILRATIAAAVGAMRAGYDAQPAPTECAVSQLPIRPAAIADLPDLLAWNVAMAWETERKQLDPAVLERGISGVFAQPRRGFYLVAERVGVPLGGLLVTYEWSDWRAGDFWWIQSVYVDPAARRGGVFRALHADVVRRAGAAGAVGIRLYVETENRRAQSTYADLGMQRCHYWMYDGPASAGTSE
jgi:ribosomal protein S18 acetylase RimI-like enzyme